MTRISELHSEWFWRSIGVKSGEHSKLWVHCPRRGSNMVLWSTTLKKIPISSFYINSSWNLRARVSWFQVQIFIRLTSKTFFLLWITIYISLHLLIRHRRFCSRTKILIEGKFEENDFTLLSRFSSFKKTIQITVPNLLAISLFKGKIKYPNVLTKEEQNNGQPISNPISSHA